VTGATGVEQAIFANAAIVAGNTGDTYNLKNTDAAFVTIGFTGYSGATATAKNISINSSCDTFTVLTSGYYRINANFAFYAVPFELNFEQYVWAQLWNQSTSTVIRDFSLGTYSSGYRSDGPDYMLKAQNLIVPLNAGDAIQLQYQLFPTAPLGTDSQLFLGAEPFAGDPTKSPGPTVGISLTLVRIGDL
jgi:hypothetical protein